MSKRQRTSFEARHGIMVPGDYVQLFDRHGQEPPVRATVRVRVSRGYVVSAPWTIDGTTFISDASENKTWRRVTRVVY